MKRRSLLFWPVALLALALAAWWVLHVPYDPERMYAAIPAGATFVTQHRGLVDRWDAFSSNPVTRSLLSSLGIKASALKGLTEDPESEAWFRKLASKDVVLAFVPELGGYGEPAWVFASWLGGESQRLRWSLSWGRVPGYAPRPPHRGRPCWEVESKDLDPDVTITISFVEGMLVGCLARDPRVIGDVLDAYDGQAPSVTSGEGWAWSGEAAGGRALDRGWFNLSGLHEEHRLAPRALAYEFTQLTATSLAGRLSADVLSAASQPVPQEGALDQLAGLVGDLPLAFAVTRTALLLPWIEAAATPAWARVVRDVIRQERADTAMVAVLGGDFSGRFKAIKVPAIVVGIPVAGREGVATRIQQALDRLNARYRWGLISTAVGSNEVYAIEGTALESHAGLAFEEKPAYAIVGGWLLFGSNLGSLSRVVARYEDPAARAAAPSRWRRELGGVGAPASAWVDLVQGAKTLRLGLATYSLKLFLEDPQGSQRLRQRLNEAKAWIDSLAPLDTGRFWATPGAGGMEIRFKLGAER